MRTMALNSPHYNAMSLMVAGDLAVFGRIRVA
jgi:hypothetical protein